MVIFSWIIIGLAILLFIGVGYLFFHKIKEQLVILFGISEMFQRELKPLLKQVEQLQSFLVNKKNQIEKIQDNYKKSIN